MRKRNSPDNAKTPGLESLRKRRYTEGLAPRTQVIEPAVTMRLPEMEPLPAKQVDPHPIRHTSSKISPVLQRALEFYNDGCTSSRLLGARMRVGKDTANGYLNRLRERKL